LAPRLEKIYEYISIIFSVVMSKYSPLCRRVLIQGILLNVLKDMHEGEIFIPAANARNVARMGEKRNAYRLLVGKPEGRRPLGRPRRRWVDNIRVDLVEVGWGDVDWIGLARDRDRWRALVNSVLNLRVP
jgi:hypothetical protein